MNALTEQIKNWLETFYGKYGVWPTRVWVERDYYRAMVSEARRPFFPGSTLFVMGIPVHER